MYFQKPVVNLNQFNNLINNNMNNNTLPAGWFFNAQDVAQYIKMTFGSEFSEKFINSRFPDVHWRDKNAFVRSSDVMTWFLSNFDNKKIHPATKFWAVSRTVAHQYYVEMECDLIQFFQPKTVDTDKLPWNLC